MNLSLKSLYITERKIAIWKKVPKLNYFLWLIEIIFPREVPTHCIHEKSHINNYQGGRNQPQKKLYLYKLYLYKFLKFYCKIVSISTSYC